jgi:16S rRNA (cytidine1402-2'-O)-methyltransferase
VTPGTLYVIATPIGNLEDLTLRALRILKEVDLVACEDTRRTRQLLAALDLRAELVSLHAHNEGHRAPQLVERMVAGEDVARYFDASPAARKDSRTSTVVASCARSPPRPCSC